MFTADRILFAFVDPKDPFTPGEVLGEDRLGPVLSILAARRFDRAFLFYTPHTRENAEATRRELQRRHPKCAVTAISVPVSDPKDYSALMGGLARQVREINRKLPGADVSVCVSSGTAEMRAAWFLLTASGVLPATLLQIGSPAGPLFGAPNVKEVRLDSAEWDSLRDLLMPREYFGAAACVESAPTKALAERRSSLRRALSASLSAPAPEAPYPDLDPALLELGISIGSAVMRAAAERAAVAADSDLPVLLLGETGSGKEVFAKLIHRLSPRRGRDLVPVNCAAMPKELVESHLFGHVRGAFTGATNDAKGKFQKASGSTLFLDEIGELPLDAQAKLLRVLQDRRVEPVGSNRAEEVDVRIVAATNRNLAAEVAAGRFRQDLYYRLEVVEIRLPALRERRPEIPVLALSLLERINQRRKEPKRLSKAALARLERHGWPGNVRELSNVLERSVLYARECVIDAPDLIMAEPVAGGDPFSGLPEPSQGFLLEQFLAQVKKQLVLKAMAKANGNQSAAAGMLGVTRQAISKYLRGQDDNDG